jgi:hypothetical protein
MMKRPFVLFRVEWMLIFIWVAGFALNSMQRLADPDTPWHLASGLYILKHHVIPATDPFSWTMHGKPWVTQEWLFEVCLAWLAKHFGFAGIWTFMVIVHTLTVLVLYRLGVLVAKGNRIVGALTACTGTLVGLVFWTVRPQVISYLMFAIFLLILQYVRLGRYKALFWVPPCMLVWANAHATASIGVILLLLEVLLSFVPNIGRLKRIGLPRGARWRLLVSALVGFLVGLINPNGIRAYTYAWLSTNSLMTNNIMEWHSPDFHSDYFKYGVLSFLVVAFLILLVRSVKLPLRETLYFGGTFAITLIHQRFMPYVALTAVPLFSDVLKDALLSLMWPSRFLRWFNAVIVIGFGGFFTTQLGQVKGSVDDHWDVSAYPVYAVQYMQIHRLPTRLLNAYHWGGFLLYKGIPTFIDGRTDIYLQDDTFSDYLAMSRVWWNTSELLDKYHIDAVLFPSGDPIITYLSHVPGWHEVYRDMNAAIIVRNTADKTRKSS